MKKVSFDQEKEVRQATEREKKLAEKIGPARKKDQKTNQPVNQNQEEQKSEKRD